jgi:hypothetical protein
MLKTLAGAGALFALCAAAPGIVRAQAVVEAGLAAGGAATTAAPAARGIGKSIAGALGGLENTLNAAKGEVESRPSASSGSAKAVDRKPAAPAPVYEDPSRIRAGLAYSDLIRRFGPPTMDMNSATGGRSLDYTRKETSVHLELADGKVSAVSAVTREPASFVLPGK